MNAPKLILADEPTSGLDNKNCAYVIDLLLDEALASDAALIIVSHDDRLRAEINDCIELITNTKWDALENSLEKYYIQTA